MRRLSKSKLQDLARSTKGCCLLFQVKMFHMCLKLLTDGIGPLAQIQAIRKACFLFYLNNFQSQKNQTLQLNHTVLVLPRASPSGPERALGSARCGVVSGRALLSGSFVPKEMTQCLVVRDGMTPNLIDSRLIWQALLHYGGLEWQKSVKRHPEQEIKILENFDRICDKDKLLLVQMMAQNKIRWCYQLTQW